jgi:hypothetical protein
MIRLIVENTFTDSDVNSKEMGITVFDRVFNKLVRQNSPLGKVHPIYLKTCSLEKTIGVLTLNESGSYSLFLELPGQVDFDHLTFNKNLQKDTHHYTRTTESGREKVLPISAQLLTNGIHHAATIIIKDLTLLKDIPNEVIYPEVEKSKLHRIEKAFFNSGTPEGSTVLELNGDSGAICLQLFLLPRSVDYKQMNIFLQPFTQIQSDFNLEDGTNIQNYLIAHDQHDEYMIGILCFLYTKTIEPPFLIFTAAKQQGFYSKIEIKRNKKGKF